VNQKRSPKHCKVLEWSLTDDHIKVHFNFSRTESLSSPTSEIKLNSVSPNEINTAHFTQHYKSIGTKWPESSYFSPFITKDINNSLHLVFFGGAQNIKYWTCNYPAIIDIQITNSNNTIDATEYFNYTFKMPRIRDKVQTLIDYAAVHFTIDGIVYYILHGGYICYSSEIVSSLYYITFNSNMDITFNVKDKNSTVA